MEGECERERGSTWSHEAYSSSEKIIFDTSDVTTWFSIFEERFDSFNFDEGSLLFFLSFLDRELSGEFHLFIFKDEISGSRTRRLRVWR